MSSVNNKNLKNIRLTITENCNLDCIYCYEKNKTTNKMDYETAKKIITAELRHSPENVLNIEFFGGEPFLNFELIKDISKYIWTGEWRVKPNISICTNGTQFSDEIKEWIIENNSRLEIGISLDGDKETQDHNRHSSFNDIDYDFISTLSNATIKMTITFDRIKHLAEDLIFLHKLRLPIGCNIDYDSPWPDNEEIIEIISYQLAILEQYYLKNPDVRVCTILDMPIQTIILKPVRHINKYCGAGNTIVTYSVDGQKYPCQGFMPLSNKSMNLENISFPELIPVDCFDSECQSCIILNSCPNCYATNLIQRGSIYKKDLSKCKIIKLFYSATAHLTYMKIMNNQDSKELQEKIRLLYCIKQINDKLS
ncbi:MAG: radical SAM protein [Acholeplasmataceae bacterium]|nr:radical SAM protein [Acholeplasmataceae bacterium]